jgi:tRNA threonylcarbamoyladenosine biosynthesis protein TsaE
MPVTVTRALAAEAATAALGAALASGLQPGLVLHLRGPLGAGKTTLARALLRALGEGGRVRSPTFTLLEPYRAGGFDLVHLDLYRLEHADELIDSGLNEYLGTDTIVLIEWPERAARWLPQPDLDIELLIDGDARSARLTAHNERGAALLSTPGVSG